MPSMKPTKAVWTAPKLKRIAASLAENGLTSSISDNGNNNKS